MLASIKDILQFSIFKIFISSKIFKSTLSLPDRLIVVFLFLLFIKKTPLIWCSAVTLALYTILAVFYWQISPEFLYVSYGKGFFVALDIFIIIFGAIFFLEILKDLKIIKNISYYLGGLSKDYRVQIIVIAWLLEAFIEGTAGFGTPAAIAVPLLIGLGLPPLRALIVGLLGNSIPGVFGAAGTPIKIGFAGLNTVGVPFFASLLNLVGFIVPVFMLWMITRGRENKNKEFFGALPFAIWKTWIPWACIPARALLSRLRRHCLTTSTRCCGALQSKSSGR